MAYPRRRSVRANAVQPPVAIHWLVPGDPATPTGGYRYDREIVTGLRELGHDVSWHRLGDDFPEPSRGSLAHAADVLASVPDGEAVVVDGLAGGYSPPSCGWFVSGSR